MSRINFELHYIQQEILKELGLDHKGLKFSQITMQGLESEHMNYHLKKLQELFLVKKQDDIYLLTDQGKDYVDSLDDEYKFVEKQPKTSVLIRALRKDPKTYEVEHLLSRRLEHPYYGKVGKIGGKVRFGETLYQAAERELYEETGLVGKNFILNRFIIS